jgi:AcrR family transcriptional regulator
MMGETRTKLLQGALETLRTRGIAGASARTIAATAGVNQALIFYHFGSVDELLIAACRDGAADRVARYRDRFASVNTMAELLELGRALHAEERTAGNLAVLAQLLAGGQTDAKLAPATADGLNLWVAEIERALTRILADTPLPEVMDIGGLARAVAAAFVGLELYEGVDEESAGRAMAAVEQFAALVTVLDDLGPVARRAIHGRLRRVAESS